MNSLKDSVDSPSVSVIVPAYNVESYLAYALDSLRRQIFEDFEVLIVDDGSTDRTSEIAKKYSQIDSRFKLLIKKNGGLSSARNFGIDHSKGRYIAFLDADDAFHSEKLKTHVDILEADFSIGLVYSASKIIQDSGATTWYQLSGKPLYKEISPSLLCKNFVGHGSNAILRRSVIEQVGKFDETLKSSEDIDYWLRISLSTDWNFKRIPQPLSYYRVRPSGLSFDLEKMHLTQQRVLEKALEFAPSLVRPILPKAYAFMYRYLARVAMTSGDFCQAREWLKKAWASDFSIFFQDVRSFLTLFSAWALPLVQPIIVHTLGQNHKSSA